MAYFKDYPYVDAFYHHRATDKPLKWIRILRKDVDKKIRVPSGNLNVFTTVQCYADAISSKEQKKIPRKTGEVDDSGQPEPHYCPLYFDFDAKPESYNGDVQAARGAAQVDAAKLVQFFFDLGVEPAYVKAYFSGDKGFHITVHPDVFAIKPHRYLSYIVGLAASHLKEQLRLSTLDLAVYSIARMWRLRNSAHKRSGLYKIELYSHELAHKPTDEIVQLAKTPRHEQLWDAEEFVNIQPVGDAVEWCNHFIDRFNAETEMRLLRPKLKVLQTEEWPACVKDVVENGPKRPGSRNQATLALTGYFKDVGLSEAETKKIILDWNHRFFHKEGDHKLFNRNANALSVIRSVYGNPEHYRFGCQFMLALKGATRDKHVKCVGIPSCPTVNGKTGIEKEEGQRPNTIPTVSLNQVGSAAFNAQPVKFSFHVSGKAKDVYVVPRDITATCTPQPHVDMCKTCPNLHFVEEEMDDKNSAGVKAKRTETLDYTNRLVLSLVDMPDEKRKSRLKIAMGIPGRCMQHSIEIETKGDVEKLRLIPVVDDIGSYVPLEDTDAAISGSFNGIDDEHVVLQAFHLVDPSGGRIKANQKYIAEGVPYESPKDQSATVLIYKHQPAQDDISSFRLTPELHRQLRVFQVARNQTVAEKMDDIHEDFEINVHRIYGRRDVAFALDMSYHSVLSFWFQEQRIQKGWVELLIIGDTGQGKTEMVKAMIRHYRLGEMTGAEGSKRTGLVWAMVPLGGTFELEWGKIPQNDQRLLVIDEFSGMAKEIIGEMTRLRSEGIAESQGTNQQQTYARTRLVLLTNPRDGHPMNYYDHGSLAVRGLCDSVADIRRIDIAVAVDQKDLPEDVANQLHGKRKKEHIYTQDLCRNLILFAWSRREQDVFWEPGTTELILEAAKVMGPKFECSVGLVSTSDQRLKIARLAIACACRVYSVKEDDGPVPHRVYVKKEHVRFVVDLLSRVYTAKNMQLDRVADRERKKSTVSASEDKRLRKELRKFANWPEIVAVLSDTGYWRKEMFSEQTGLSKEETSEFIRWASRNRMVQSTGAGYRKNPVFTDLLKRININSLEPEDDDIGDDPSF